MILRGIDFGNVWCQSGAMGFFGEGYPYHRYLKHFGLTYNNCTFVAKTTPVPPRAGLMPLKSDGITPVEFYPKCIYVKFWKGVALNAVSLSSPGLEVLLAYQHWQNFTRQFMISYMSVEPTEEQKLAESREFVQILKPRLREFRVRPALQRNYSCPNAGQKPQPPDDFVKFVRADLDILSGLDIPIVVKLVVTTEPTTAYRIAQHKSCDAVLVSNTIPWGTYKDATDWRRIDWKGLFGSDISPLQARVGMNGGLSGKVLLPHVRHWLTIARTLRFPKPIAAGGGILHPNDGVELSMLGAGAICVGSMSFLRFWRNQSTIDAANEEYRNQERILYPSAVHSR